MTKYITPRIKKNQDLLKCLTKMKQSNQSLIISSLESEAILAIIECALNIIFRKVPLSDSQLQWMRAKEKDLSTLISKRTHLTKQRKILKQQDYLKQILSPVIKYMKQL